MKPEKLTMLFELVIRFTDEAKRQTLTPVELAMLEIFLRQMGETAMADSVVAYFKAKVERTRSDLRARAMLN